jgi:hypothetical protein
MEETSHVFRHPENLSWLNSKYMKNHKNILISAFLFRDENYETVQFVAGNEFGCKSVMWSYVFLMIFHSLLVCRKISKKFMLVVLEKIT